MLFLKKGLHVSARSGLHQAYENIEHKDGFIVIIIIVIIILLTIHESH